MKNTPQNIHPIFEHLLQRADKEKLLQQRGVALWLTGLSGSGKSTLARGLEQRLYEQGMLTQVLDGDNVRTGINNNLGFSDEDRTENIRRIAEVTKLFVQCGIVTICSFVSPTIAIRQLAQQIIGPQDFLEVYINAPLEVCEQRDVKGLYKKPAPVPYPILPALPRHLNRRPHPTSKYKPTCKHPNNRYKPCSIFSYRISATNTHDFL